MIRQAGGAQDTLEASAAFVYVDRRGFDQTVGEQGEDGTPRERVPGLRERLTADPEDDVAFTVQERDSAVGADQCRRQVAGVGQADRARCGFIKGVYATHQGFLRAGAEGLHETVEMGEDLGRG